MEPSSPPSIMGAENPKFTVSTLERRAGAGQAMSDSESMDLASHLHDAMSTSMMSARKSKDGLSREERMKVVRERQLEEHRRRLDELRQAQMQAMRAKQQLDTQRRRRVEEMKSKDEQRRAAVEERRRRLEDAERNRREAILRKHQEIFERIDQKRRQHESRRAAFGQQQQSPSDEGYPSRRAVSVGVLSSRNSLMSRSYHHSHVFSPGSVGSARHQASPGTPSRTGGLLESVSGNSSDNSPVHNGRHGKHFRITQSHPPPTKRNRTREQPTPRRVPVGMAASVHTDGSKTERAPAARRPTSLVARGRDDSDLSSKMSQSRSTDTFKILSKRSQSVGNVNGRKAEPAVISARPVEPADGESMGESEETGDARNRRKITSEAEAKAALAEKRRLARLKAETERMELVTPSSRGVDESVSPSHPADEWEEDKSPRKGERSQSIVMFEQDEARMEQVRSSEDLTQTNQDQTDTATHVRDEAPEEVADSPERTTTPEALDKEEEPEQTVAAEEAVDAVESETVVRPDVIPNQKVEERSASPPSEEETLPTVTTVVDDVERQREETERRRLEMEQREEEERTLRRQRLEAIKRMTKGAQGGAAPERLVSPQLETRTDALENARKLLQRRGMGSGAQSPVTTPAEEKPNTNGITVNGASDADFDPFGSNGAPAAWDGAEHKKPDPWGAPNGHLTLTASSDLLLNFE